MATMKHHVRRTPHALFSLPNNDIEVASDAASVGFVRARNRQAPMDNPSAFDYKERSLSKARLGTSYSKQSFAQRMDKSINKNRKAVRQASSSLLSRGEDAASYGFSMNESNYNKTGSLVRRKREHIKADGFGIRSFVKRSNLPGTMPQGETKVPMSYLKPREPKLVDQVKSPSMLIGIKTPYGALESA